MACVILEIMAAARARFYFEGQIHAEKASLHAHWRGSCLPVVSQYSCAHTCQVSENRMLENRECCATALKTAKELTLAYQKSCHHCG